MRFDQVTSCTLFKLPFPPSFGLFAVTAYNSLLLNTEISLHTYFTHCSDLAFLSLNILLDLDYYITIHTWDLSVVLGFVPLCSHFNNRVVPGLWSDLELLFCYLVLWNGLGNALFFKIGKNLIKLSGNSVLFSGNFLRFTMVVILVGFFFSWIKLSNFTFF